MARTRAEHPTMAEVARHAGVSQATVSFVLNSRFPTRISAQTRERVIKAARQLGYALKPHTGSASTRTQTVGLLFDANVHALMQDPYVAEVFAGVVGQLQDAGISLHMCVNVTQGELRRLLNHGVHGLIYLCPQQSAILDEIASFGTPCVCIDSLITCPLPQVRADNARAGYLAAAHLTHLGHRRIAFVDEPPRRGIPPSRSYQERFDGVRCCLKELRLPIPPELRVDAPVSDADYYSGICGNPHSAGGDVVLRYLLQLPSPPTAVVFANDLLAFGAICALTRARVRVPDDVSIVGVDDLPGYTYIDPLLTTVRVPKFEMGQRAVELLRDLIAKPPKRRRRKETLLPPKLIVRNSTGAATSGR